MSVQNPVNPRLVESLDVMANGLQPYLEGPLKDHELELLEMPLHLTTATELPAMTAGLRTGAPTSLRAQVPAAERELLLGIAAPTLTSKRHKLPQVIESWQKLPADIQPAIVRTAQTVVFPTRLHRDMALFGNTESLAFYGEERAIGLASVMRVLFARLDRLPQQSIDTIGQDETTLMYKRVAKPAELFGPDSKRAIDVPTEGFVSVVQATSQAEADLAFRGLAPFTESAWQRMVHSYTAAVTYGYFGEMSLRGMRFDGHFMPNGAMTSRYHAFFTHLQKTHEPKNTGFVAANDGEGCPAARKARMAHCAVVAKYTAMFLEVEKHVQKAFDHGRADRPKLTPLSEPTRQLAAYDLETRDTAMCLQVPVR